jgi:hypothetical protein
MRYHFRIIFTNFMSSILLFALFPRSCQKVRRGGNSLVILRTSVLFQKPHPTWGGISISFNVYKSQKFRFRST